MCSKTQYTNMSEFTHNLEGLMHLTSQKVRLVEHLKKNYREHVHYVVSKVDAVSRHGGHNKIVFMLTQNAYELLKNSFNLRNRYLVEISDGIKQVNIGMCIENQTIGFIENAYNGILNVIRQHYIGKYRVDLFIVDHKLVIECDENGHTDRDAVNERIREEFIISTGHKMIRYNPNESSFDLSNVLRKINAVLFAKG
jgi:Protein of unknown function (DUF559)